MSRRKTKPQRTMRVNRPLSDAVTTEMPEMLATVPFRLAIPPHLMDIPCDWCTIRLGAIPDLPMQVDPHGPYYHAGGCIAAARVRSRGETPDLSAMIGETEGAA